MNRSSHDDNDNHDPDARLDQIAEDIRNEPIDERQADEAASRVWASLSDALLPSDHMIEGCTGYRSLIPSYLSGKLSSSRAMLLEDHTSECSTCRAALAFARSARGAIHPAEAGTNVTPFTATGAGTGAGHPEGSGSAERAHGAMSRRGPRWTWTLAAAACLTAVVAGLVALRAYRPFSPADQARVRSLNGVLYRVSAGTTEPVAERAMVRYGDTLRTAKGSDAIVELADGSLVEMNERSEIRVSAGSRDTTIALPRGDIIVQAAKRSSGHLYVASGEALVSVTGTIFSVNHGTKGSRVSVIEGEVHVAHDGAQNVLHPGDQVSTHPSMSPVPVPTEIAWSRNVDRYLAVMREMVSVRRDLDQVKGPALRYSSKLLASVPPGTVMYAAIPNISGTIDEADRRIQERIDQSEILRDWFAKESNGRVRDESIRLVLDKIRAFGSQLGDEIVVAVQAPGHGSLRATGRSGGVPPGIVVMSELRDGAAARPFFEQEVARANAAGAASRPNTAKGAVPALRMLPERLEDVSAEDSRTPHSDVLLWIHKDRLVLSTTLDGVRRVAAASDGAEANPFVTSAFHDNIAQSYAEGAGWVFAVDLQALMANVLSDGDGTGPGSALQQTGILDARQFILEVKEVGTHTQTRGVLSFDKPRRGLASWLAAPAPMGALNFVSPDSTLAAAFVVKEPVLLVDDLFGIIGAANSGFQEHLDAFEAHSGVSIREDLAASLGGEFVVAMDGPVLPVPAWKVAFEVYDPVRLQQTIEKLVTAINDSHTETDVPSLGIEQEISGGRTFYTVRGGTSALAVHYVFVDGYLLAAPQKTLLERAIQNRQTGYVLSSSPTFRDLLPQDGESNFSALIFQNMGSVLGPMAQHLAGGSSLSSDQQSTIRQISAETPATLSYAYGEADRIVFAMSGQGTIASTFGALFGLGGDTGVARMFEDALATHEGDARGH